MIEHKTHLIIVQYKHETDVKTDIILSVMIKGDVLWKNQFLKAFEHIFGYLACLLAHKL